MITEFSGKYAFLSNFYAAQCYYDNNRWSTSEHAYQAAKSYKVEEKLEIWEARTPDKAKKLGRKVSMRPDWEVVKDQIMYEIVKDKFTDEILAARLLATGDEILVEGNYWHDNYWGSCVCDKCRILPKRNQLGKTLMRVSEELRKDGNQCHLSFIF